jgi:hypothetical protein
MEQNLATAPMAEWTKMASSDEQNSSAPAALQEGNREQPEDPNDPDARVMVTPRLVVLGLLCILIGIGAGWVMSLKTLLD